MSPPRGSAHRNPTMLIRVQVWAVIAADGFRYPLTDHFSFLFLLLAWHRQAPNASDDGYVSSDVVPRYLNRRKIGHPMAMPARRTL